MVPVQLAAAVTEVGTLQLEAVARTGGERWNVELDVRAGDTGNETSNTQEGGSESVPDFLDTADTGESNYPEHSGETSNEEDKEDLPAEHEPSAVTSEEETTEASSGEEIIEQAPDENAPPEEQPDEEGKEKKSFWPFQK